METPNKLVTPPLGYATFAQCAAILCHTNHCACVAQGKPCHYCNHPLPPLPLGVMVSKASHSALYRALNLQLQGLLQGDHPPCKPLYYIVPAEYAAMVAPTQAAFAALSAAKLKAYVWGSYNEMEAIAADNLHLPYLAPGPSQWSELPMQPGAYLLLHGMQGEMNGELAAWPAECGMSAPCALAA